MGLWIKHGKLWLTFTWQGKRYRETTGLDDTPENRRAVAKLFGDIQAEMRLGIFDPSRHFPGLSTARRKPQVAPEPQLPPISGESTLVRYAGRWLLRRSPFGRDGQPLDGAEIHPSTWHHDKGTVESRLVPAFGSLPLTAITRARVLDFRQALIDEGLSAKTIQNILGVLRTMLNDAIDEDLVRENPVPRTSARRIRSQRFKKQSYPLTPAEVKTYLAALPEKLDLHHIGRRPPKWTSEQRQVVEAAIAAGRPRKEVARATGIPASTVLQIVSRETVLPPSYASGSMLRDLYSFWFRTGWRPNEVMALRFEWIDFRRQVINLILARSPRAGGSEWEPKTGPRRVELDDSPTVFEILERRRKASLETGRRDYVFTDSVGRPLSQELLHKRVWLPTLAKIGLSPRGQYNVRDTYITISLSNGREPGEVAQICGTSEAMIWRHYRQWIRGLRRDRGGGVEEALRDAAAGPVVTALSPAGADSAKI